MPDEIRMRVTPALKWFKVSILSYSRYSKSWWNALYVHSHRGDSPRKHYSARFIWALLFYILSRLRIRSSIPWKKQIFPRTYFEKVWIRSSTGAGSFNNSHPVAQMESFDELMYSEISLPNMTTSRVEAMVNDTHCKLTVDAASKSSAHVARSNVRYRLFLL